MINYTALAISILALLFTVFSFWWMNWRTGKLHVGIPRTYAAYSTQEGRMLLEFPFIFFNDGPTPIFVQNLRLLFLDEAQPRPLVFTATVKKLGKDEDRAFATQFPVHGRQALLLICQFHREPGGKTFEPQEYLMELQAKIDNDREWKQLHQFSLNVSEKSAPIISKQFVVHDNMID